MFRKGNNFERRRKIDIFKIASNCKIKGINIIETGDCLHPLWLSELKSNLIEYSHGIFTNPKVIEVYFILQTEIEVIWKNNSNVKRVHFILLFPNFEKLEESLNYLSGFGNIAIEGRPKIYISAEK